MFKSLPTMLWVIGATVAVACFSPVVGNVVTSAPAVAAPPPASATPSQPTVVPSEQPSEQPSAGPGFESPGEPSVGTGALPPTEEPATPPATPPGEEGVESAVVIKGGTTKLGPTAVDADGFTLYLSTLDSTNPPKSVCESAKCLSAWKPVYVKGGALVAGAGVEQDKLSTVVRRDEDVQATWVDGRCTGSPRIRSRAISSVKASRGPGTRSVPTARRPLQTLPDDPR